jgi:methionyl-tRNA formyltransferase
VAEALTSIGADLLVEALTLGLDDPEPQEGEVTYAHKLTTEDRRLDWARPALEIDRVVRVGGAWTTLDGRRLKVHDAVPLEHPVEGPPGTLRGAVVATGEGALELVEVQPEGKARISAFDWLLGSRLTDGTRLGGDA